MKKFLKKAAVCTLTGVMAAGMLTGCGDKKIDGTATVATVNGTDIPMGVVSLYARIQQAETEEMYELYAAYLGTSTSDIWDSTADEDTGETYGDQAVTSALTQIETMYILQEKAADYGVELTDEDETAIADAAAEFMADNDEETIAELACTEDQVKTFLELYTIQERIYDPIVAEADIELTDEELQQSTFTYTNISISDDDLTDDDIATKREEAEEILDQMLEDPTADMDEIASGVNEDYSAYTGTIYANENEDEDLQSTAYDDEVQEAVRSLEDGEVYGELIETDSSLYIVRMDTKNDEEATESERESVTSTKESDYYSETTDGWLDEAEITVNEKVLAALTITDSHTFSLKEEETTTEDTTEETSEDSTESEESTDAEDTTESEDTTEAEDTTESEETTEAEESTTETETEAEEAAAEAAEATATPTPTTKATATPTPTTKATATPTPTTKATATPTPTKKATATPTPKPTKKATATPTPKPTKKATATPTPTKKASSSED